MSVPKLRFKEFDGDWYESSIGQLTKYFKGYAFKSESYKDNGVRIIRVSDLGRDSIKYDNDAIYLDELESPDYENWMLKEHDIVITTVGSKPHLVDSAVGRPIYIRNNNEGLLNQNLLVLRPINQEVEPYFVFSQLLDNKYLTHIETIQRGNANQSNIIVKDLQEFKVFSTPKSEQTKIASFLSAVDEKISQLTQKHELLSQYKQGMMQKLFSQQIRFKADDGSEFGEWETKSIKDVADVKGGKRIPKGYALINENTGHPYITVSDMNRSYSIDSTNIRYVPLEVVGTIKRYTITDKDIFISVAGTLGIIGKIPTEFNGANLTENADKLTNLKCHQDFLIYLLDSGYLSELIESTATTSAQPKLALYAIEQLEIQIPCLEEQTKIANFLSSIDQKIEVVAQQIEQAKQWKKGLLQQMFV